MEAGVKNKNPWWLLLIEWVGVLVVLAFVVRYLVIQFEQLDTEVVRFRLLPILASVIGGTASGLLSAPVVAGYYRALGHTLGPANALAMGTLPRLARHIPGKVHSILGAAWLAHRLQGIPAKVSFTAAILMSVQTVAVSVFCGALAAPFGPLPWPWVAGLGLAGAAGVVLLHPAFCLRPLNWLLARLKRKAIQERLSYRTILALAGLASVQRLVTAGMFALLASGLLDLPADLGFYLALVYILGTLLGFLAFFAPAGIGVQEGAFLLLLVPVLPADQAAMLTVAARIWQTALLLLDAGVGAAAISLGRSRAVGGEEAGG